MTEADFIVIFRRCDVHRSGVYIMKGDSDCAPGHTAPGAVVQVTICPTLSLRRSHSDDIVHP
jgi:hypothetical protein